MEHPEIYLLIGQKLRQKRKIRDEKIQAVERATGISHSVISRIENGRYEMLSLRAIIKLTDYYGIALLDILT